MANDSLVVMLCDEKRERGGRGGRNRGKRQRLPIQINKEISHTLEFDA